MRHVILSLAGVFCFCFHFAAAGATYYVDANGTNPLPPFTNWPTAATNIQDAVDVAASGDTVCVTNGIYATGGRNWFGSGTNRVTLTNSITLQSVNGPAVTWIVGHQVSGIGSALTNTVRCVAIGPGAVLSGFTLTNGEAGGGNYPNGGGVANVKSVSSAGTVTNCILINNLATNSPGGGAYRVNLVNCQLIGNSAYSGGGALACSLVNCLVVSNRALGGGGVYGDSTFGYSTLNGCTIVGNTANTGGGVSNGGNGAMNNCIVYYNSGGNYSGTKLNNCCTTPILANDFTSFTNEPVFQNVAAGNFHLQTNSPCINAGGNSFATNATELDGNPRIVAGTVDVGAYEFQTPGSTLSYVWAQQYGLPTDGSADQADADGDGMNNWQEWRTGTNPTNSASLLQTFPPPAANNSSGITISWPSVNGIFYLIQRANDLSSFTTIKTNLAGTGGLKFYTDTAATNAGPYFYRVGVQQPLPSGP